MLAETKAMTRRQLLEGSPDSREPLLSVDGENAVCRCNGKKSPQRACHDVLGSTEVQPYETVLC